MSLERFDGGRVGRALFLYAGPADVMRGGASIRRGDMCCMQVRAVWYDVSAYNGTVCAGGERWN